MKKREDTTASVLSEDENTSRKEDNCTEGGSSKDGEESQAISLDTKQVSGKETTYKGLPTPGKWIKWNSGKSSDLGSWSKGEVMEYTEMGVEINNMNGVDLNELTQQDVAEDHSLWSYCEIPGQEEKEKAEWEGLNREIGHRFCNKCNCVTKKLQICKGCYKVYYCDETCQLDNWSSHKDDCKREKTVRRPDPRYPLSELSTIWKEVQVRTQNERHQVLQAALNGNFTVKHSEGDLTVAWHLVHGPKSTDLVFGNKYELNVNSEVFTFEWEGLNPMEHSIPEGHPTSCVLFESMEEHLNDEEFMEEFNQKVSLQYIAGMHLLQLDSVFWSMVINFNTYGTVAPFDGPCRCNSKNVKAQMPPERRELRKKWNKFFKRAKADINDVQCMYSASKVGCQNYENCPYKHQVEVKKEKKKTPT